MRCVPSRVGGCHACTEPATTVYYSTHEPFASQSSGIPAIGTTATGVMYLASPLVAIGAQRWPKLRRPGMVFGLVVMLVALVAASFCNTVSGLIATQGVLYGVGGLFAYFPALQYIDGESHQ